MNTPLESPEFGAMERRLADLHRSLDAAVESASRKQRVSLIVMLVVAVGMSIYLFFAYSMIADFQVTDVTGTLEVRAQERLASSRGEMAEALKQAAPGMFDEAETLILDLPGSLAQEARRELSVQIRQATPALEEELLATVGSSLEALRAEIGVTADQQITEDQFRRVMNNVAESFGLQLTEMADRLYATYQEHFGNHIDELSRVAKGETLDEREDRRRRIIMLLKAMYDKYGSSVEG